MKRIILICVLVLSIHAMAQDGPDWAALQKEFFAEFQAAAPEQQFTLVESFLRKHPQMPQAERILSAGIHACLNSLKSPEKGESLIRAFLASDRTKEQVLIAELGLVQVYGAGGKADELQELIAEVTRKELHPRNYETIAQAALDARLFELALEYCDKVESQTTLESLTKSFRNNEDLARIVYSRTLCENLTRKGAALLGLGNPDEALLELKKAEKMAPTSFLGTTQMQYPYFTGMAYSKQRNLQKAVDVWAPAAIFQHDDKSLAALKAAYLELGNKEEEFGYFLAEKRKKIAQAAPDFTLNTFDGKPVSLSSFKGKVVFLNFWSYG